MDEKTPASQPPGLTPGGTKLVQGPEISFLEDAPENAVVLSPRLKRLCSEVGGCQSTQVEAVIRRVLYEVAVHERRR